MTSCDEPYIGDESMSRPPSAKNARMTSAQASRATRSLPTLKVIQLPSPMTGRASPVEGTARVRTGTACAVPNEGTTRPAPAANTLRRNRRRQPIRR